MFIQPEKFIQIKAHDSIFMCSNPKSTALRIVVITNNVNKFAEFTRHLGNGYGMNVQQWKTDVEINNEEALTCVCEEIMSAQSFSPHFILKEESSLISQCDGKDLSKMPIEQLSEFSLESVLHTSSLTVVKPQWTIILENEQEKRKLIGFTLRDYEKRSYGYIQEKSKIAHCTLGFGWDSCFVNAATNLTNEEFYVRYGKISARQHTISSFIESYLRYKTLLTLKHHKLPLSQPIVFGKAHYLVSNFIKEEKHLSNPHISDWGIDKLRAAVLNEGLFFKGAWSRPVKNYFSPPFSGLPLTVKKDGAEETIFMQHDMLHHLVCDLICDVPKPSKLDFYVYSAWRMLSESFTLVLADMLYADGLIKTGVMRDCVDKRIYPLFESISKVQSWADSAHMSKEERLDAIKKLLLANSYYALLGDDNQWKTLITQSNGSINEEHLARLNAYKDHFGKFFIGDNAWTRANFDNMQKQSVSLHEWINSIGREQFKRANIPLLSEIAQEVRTLDIDYKDYAQVVEAVFDIIFNTKIKSHLACNKVVMVCNEVQQSRAFRRYLIGQTNIISRYPSPLNLNYIPQKLFARIQDEALFSNDEQDNLRALLKKYILGIEGLRLMTREEALNAIDCSPVFPPVYISYPEMQAQYKSISNCVAELICHHEGFDDNPKHLSAFSGTFFNANSFVDKAPSTKLTCVTIV